MILPGELRNLLNEEGVISPSRIDNHYAVMVAYWHFYDTWIFLNIRKYEAPALKKFNVKIHYGQHGIASAETKADEDFSLFVDALNLIKQELIKWQVN